MTWYQRCSPGEGLFMMEPSLVEALRPKSRNRVLSFKFIVQFSIRTFLTSLRADFQSLPSPFTLLPGSVLHTVLL